ncbi:MAG: type II toxin-antitoxin system RelE/ParE family toxin [Candidatus Aenigmatarchaeota archaeon]
MMAVLIHDAADKSLRSFEKKVRERIKQQIKLLAENPYSTQLDIVKLKGINDGPDLFRMRVGNYRVIYFIQDGKILITDIGRRERIYG